MPLFCQGLAILGEPIKTQGMTTTPERSATLTELVAAQIRSLLGYRDMKPAELARSIGENDQWVHVRLKGKVPLNVNDMHRIAGALGVGVHELLPPPDVAARAASPRANAHYFGVAERTSDQPVRPSRPRDNRPVGRPGAAAPGRTGYLPRGRRA
jgi:hypothetical protein